MTTLNNSNIKKACDAVTLKAKIFKHGKIKDYCMNKYIRKKFGRKKVKYFKKIIEELREESRFLGFNYSTILDNISIKDLKGLEQFLNIGPKCKLKTKSRIDRELIDFMMFSIPVHNAWYFREKEQNESPKIKTLT